MGCMSLYRGLGSSAIGAILRITFLNEKLWLMFLIRYALKGYGDLQVTFLVTTDTGI